MKYLAWPPQLQSHIILTGFDRSASCHLHRPGHRELGVVARRFWQMSPSESTGSFNFPEFVAPARTPIGTVLEKIRVRIAGKPKKH